MAMQRILLAASYKYEFYAPAWKRALESLDVTVIPFDWDTCWSKGIINRIEPRFLVGPTLSKINQQLKDMTNNVKPDIILIYAGLPVHPETVKNLARTYWVAGYHNDDPFGRYGKKAYFRWFKAGIPYYSSHHVYRQKNLIEYQQLGVQYVALLMSYYCPWLSYPTYKPGAPEYPVVFVGNSEPGPRTEYLTYLVQHHIPVRVFGYAKGWQRYLPKSAYRALLPIIPVLGEAYNVVITNAKISLAFFNASNNDQYTRRIFEIPACRGFLLAQRTPVMQELYTEGKEAEYFDSPEELINKIRYYLSHETERLKIAEAGYQRCLSSGYDIYSRMRQWLADTQHWMQAKD
jgi:spore maturation protein CgeB